MTPIARAIALAGGQAALARRLSISTQAVHLWLRKNQVPAERCRQIEASTNGQITRYELRPDVFGEPPGEPVRRAQAAGRCA